MSKRLVRYYMVDAFANSPFTGNPAAVCLLEEEKNDVWLELIAKEINMPAISYLTRITNLDTSNPIFSLRWFNRAGVEVPLCGHATMAAAHTLFTSCLEDYNTIEFSTRSGILKAKRNQEIKTFSTSKSQNAKAEECFLIELDLPVIQVSDHNGHELSSIMNGANVIDTKIAKNGFVIIEVSSCKDVVDFQPDLDKMKAYPANGFIITGLASPNSGIDFYSRTFIPKGDINEDFVCGSAHCALALYWSNKLGKFNFVARSASARGGNMDVHLDQLNQRVLLQGMAIKITEGFILA